MLLLRRIELAGKNIPPNNTVHEKKEKNTNDDDNIKKCVYDCAALK